MVKTTRWHSWWRWIILGLLAVAGLGIGVCYALSARTGIPADSASAGRLPRIDPDYTDCWLPPNIAPLNFRIQEDARQFRVHAYTQSDEGFVVAAGSDVQFPLEPWHALLERSRGQDLSLDIYALDSQGKWRKFSTVTNHVAPDKIDSHLVYRLLGPLHNLYREMGIYQRNLETFEQTPVVTMVDNGRCVNCHTFNRNDPNTMLFHVRSHDGLPMILAQNGHVSKIDARTKTSPGPAAYSAWHPSGKVIAFSKNKLTLNHHMLGENRDVFDYRSSLSLYDVAANRLIVDPRLADPNQLDTFPAWSPDGRFLYFCRTLRTWNPDLEKSSALPPDYANVKYDLMRISFDIDTRTFGQLETVLAADQTKQSNLEPRVSPDGRFLVFCMCKYGSFPPYSPSSDLYMMDLTTGKHWPLEELNSDRCDSWHSWSSNGRWLAFASKRQDGLFNRVYIGYVDASGKARKPLLLPQQDPAFYDSFLKNFNAPELVSGPIPLRREEINKIVLEGATIPVRSGTTNAGEAIPQSSGQAEYTSPQ